MKKKLKKVKSLCNWLLCSFQRLSGLYSGLLVKAPLCTEQTQYFKQRPKD